MSDEGRRLWQRYFANAVDVPGVVTERIGEAAQASNAYVVGHYARPDVFEYRVTG